MTEDLLLTNVLVSLDNIDKNIYFMIVDKIRRDWETGLKQVQQTPASAHTQPLATPKGAISTSAFVSGSSVARLLEVSRTSTQSEPVVKLPLSIATQSLDIALSMTQPWQF